MRSRSLKLLEHETKAIFNAHDIPIPRGRTAKTPAEAENIAHEISDTVVIKAQVPFGGRGKAGGIKSCETSKETAEIARSLFNNPLKGTTVDTLLVEEKLQIAREFYFGITIDRTTKTYVAITSSEGGVDIEEVASKSPEKIIKKSIDPMYGFQEYHARSMTSRLNLRAQKQTAVANIMLKLYRISVEYDAELIEINPLVETQEGKFVAADARLIVDDNALFRQKELETQANHRTELSPLEAEARKLDMAYVDLDGDIGIIGNGAGLVMATLDMVQLYGGKPANFLDVGGGATADTVMNGLKIVLAKPGVKLVLINILGGITRCDEVAGGILEASKTIKPMKPLVIRLVGTRENEAMSILKEAGYQSFKTMEDVVEKAVSRTRSP